MLVATCVVVWHEEMFLTGTHVVPIEVMNDVVGGDVVTEEETTIDVDSVVDATVCVKVGIVEHDAIFVSSK
jgi:hypothetical protein